MSVSRWKLAAMPVALVVVASPLLANCSGGLPGLDGSALGDVAGAMEGCPEFEKGDFSGVAKLDASAKGFLEASAKFTALVKEMEVGLIEACGELGKALDVPEAELKAEPKDGEGAKKVCGAVSAKLDAFMKANADAQLSIELTAPKCYADVDTMMKCFGDCGSPVQPGELKASCEGGEISGKCDGKCSGSCQVEAGAECKGTCSGSCSGKCDAKFSGTCGGKCDGKCDGKDSKGASCAGTCEGKCDAKAEGTCGGACEGKCDAKCEVKATGKCEGTCSGGCDVDVKEPKCSGEFKPPKVSIQCQAQCSAKAAANFKCDPPGISIVAKGKGKIDAKVISGLRKALPKIAEIGMGKAKAIGEVGVTLATQVKDAAQGIAKAGAKAAVCATVAAEGVASAVGGIKVNAEVSVNVSASASGKAGTK